MRILLIFLILSFNVFSEVRKFDSHTSKLYNLKISRGVLVSVSNDKKIIDTQIKKQLSFLVGILNHYNSGPELTKLEYKIIKITEDTASSLYKIDYEALIPVAWNKSLAIPRSLNLILPERAGPKFLEKFYSSQISNLEFGNCVDNLSMATVLNHFYHFRPESYGCKLKDRTDTPDDLVVYLNGEFELSLRNSQNKSPEYAKVWEDNELKVFMTYGFENIENPIEHDIGANSFRDTANTFLSAYGKPFKSNIDLTNGIDLNVRFIDWQFNLAEGKILTIRMLLATKMSIATSEEESTIAKYTPNADLVIYSGHAGLGANILGFLRSVEFKANKYQIYFLNGCDTFSYIPLHMYKTLENLNPGTKGTKWLDLISNSMPAYFSELSHSGVTLVDSLIQKNRTYVQILSGLDPAQTAVVNGEEDN